MAKDNRPSWDQYFMTLANEVATRTTCMRRAVGDKIGGQPEIAIMTHLRIPPVFGYQIGTL